MLKVIVSWLLLTGLGMVLPGAALAQAGKAPDPLTVVGAIQNSNRPAADANSDVFPDYHGKTPHRIFAFDWAALEALPQSRIHVRADSWGRSIVAQGPRLRDAMDAAGVPTDARIELIAMDGFSLLMTADDRARREWILAIEIEDIPLDFGGPGPIWLLYDTAGKSAPPGAEAGWIWSLFLIQVPDWNQGTR